MIKRIFTKKNIIRVAICLGLSLGVCVSSVMVGAFVDTNIVDTLVYASRSERKSDGTNFTYIEATSKDNSYLFNDFVATDAVVFDNYWHFANRPDNFAFKKWDICLNKKTNEYVYPLSFDYNDANYSTPIISIIGNRWEGDLSHLGLKVMQDDFKFDINDNIAIQNSVLLSYSLAVKLSPTDVNLLVGQKVDSNVMFLNPYFNQARYNNSPSSDVIDEMNIVGVFDYKSSQKMARYVGNDFVFMFGGREGTYNHCGIKIGCHLSTDDYANNVSISRLLMLDNEKSDLTFYNYKNGQMTIGSLHSKYLKTKNVLSSSFAKFSPVLFSLLLCAFLVLYWFLIIRRKTLLDIFACAFSLIFVGLLISLIKMISFGSLCITLLNPFGSGLFFLVAIAIVIVLSFSRKKEIDRSEERCAEKKKTHRKLLNVLSFITQTLSFTSLYIAAHSLLVGNRYFLLSSLVAFLGMFMCLIFVKPSFNISKSKIRKPVLLYIVNYIAPIFACALISIGIIFAASRFIPDLTFNIKVLLICVAGMAVQFVLTRIIKSFIVDKEFSFGKSDDYTETDI